MNVKNLCESIILIKNNFHWSNIDIPPDKKTKVENNYKS